MSSKQKRALVRIILSAAALGCLALWPGTGALRLLAYGAVYLIIGGDILLKAAKGIGNRQLLDENFLMSVATLGAFALALYQGSGDYAEAIAVMLFYQVGEWFQRYAVGKSRRDISRLMDIRPDYANLEVEGQVQRVDPEQVEVGSVILVRPGEKVPIDGEVIEGDSALDTAALTGESLPRQVRAGDPIVSGSVNLTGVLRVRTTREFGQSTVAKILDLVENASARKAKSEDFIAKFARVYTPAVCLAALALALVPPLVQLLAGLPGQWAVWTYRALTFLVISCPCALVISIPLSFFSGIGGASRAGVLVKGANYLEALAQTQIVMFDKTGTLTQGVFQVSGIHHSSMEEAKLLEYAALVESASSHPISQSLRRAWGKPLDARRVTDIREIAGQGVSALVDGLPVAAGNGQLMRSLGLSPIPCRQAGTLIHMAVDGAYAGHILICDQVKPRAKEAIAALRQAGVGQIAMLTGDLDAPARQTARVLGVDQVYSQLLPAGKVEQVERAMADKPPRAKLAFVGDGINDAPVLSRADVGIAMGAMGSDAAIEAADVVLMDDDPMKIASAIRIARKCMAIVKQNISFAIGVKLLCLLLGALGLANMWLSIFADVGVMVIAVLNALRALFVGRLLPTAPAPGPQP